MLVLDGTMGEGGGQVLRTALSLSLYLQRPFRILNLRARRRRPGLRPQHLAAVRAAAEIGDALVERAEIGSQELTFRPRRLQPGNYHFDIGTAGSATLVAQTVLLPLLTAPGPSQIVIDGGTHNAQAPPYEFLARTFLPLVSGMGPRLDATLERHGFYPNGGGRIRLHIEPVPRLHPLTLTERGAAQYVGAEAVLARLPRHIATRELSVVQQRLRWHEEALTVREAAEASGPGNVLLLTAAFASVTEVCVGFGRRGVPAETVAGEAVGDMADYLAADVPVDRCLADQLLLPMALAGGGVFVTTVPSRHTETNAQVLHHFMDVAMRVHRLDGTRYQLQLDRA